MHKKTFTETGYVHNVDLVHEFGAVSSPLQVYHSLEEYDRAYPVDQRDEYDFPIKVTLTYEIEVLDEEELQAARSDLEEILKEIEDET